MVNIQHKLILMIMILALWYCKYFLKLNNFLQPSHSKGKVQTYFKAASLTGWNPFSHGLQRSFSILCFHMCLHYSCWLLHTFSHVLLLVPVLCFIYLNCATTQKKQLNVKKRFMSQYNTIELFWNAFLSSFYCCSF